MALTVCSDGKKVAAQAAQDFRDRSVAPVVLQQNQSINSFTAKDFYGVIAL